MSAGRAKIAAALVLTAPFVPMLFQGEEFAASSPFQYFTHHDDQELGRNVSEGRRNEFRGFGWKPEDVPDPQDEQTFLRSKLRWEEVSREPHSGMLDWYRRLIALRRSTASLSDGSMRDTHVRFDERAKWLAVRRGGVELICNLGQDRQAIPATVSSKNVLASDTEYQIRPSLIELPPDSVVIFY